ncbi:MAG: PTS sugar transporter subunit IIA [Spirochaetaceae bacterium]|jgi:mannitol/fructose-specific phosphotransferase system IIA component|nr:PTS sugar transporter subunit IIA [Spirochaetaceae bacterium]
MGTPVLKLENIVLNVTKEPSDDVIRRAGQMLHASGYVTERYIEGMLARDKQLSVAIGNCIAIPHGEVDYKKDVVSTGLVVLTYPDAIDWNGQKVHIVIGIAAKGGEHNDILGNIVDIFGNEHDVAEFLKITDKQKILDMLCA